MSLKSAFTATLICAAFVAGQALSQEGDKSGTNGERGGSSPATQQIKDAGLAQQLAQWGRANNSPAALAVASQILSGASAKALPEQATAKTSEGEGGDAAEKPAVAYTADSLMAEAQDLAGINGAGLVAAIAESSPSSRGDVTGPNCHNDRVNANTTDSYEIVFRGGEAAEIAVSGDGDTDLDLRVYDENGNLIVSDLDGTDQCYVCWTPAWTGKFTIRIQNLGSVYNAYTLMTN